MRVISDVPSILRNAGVVFVSALAATSCAGRAQTPTETPRSLNVSQLWMEPRDLESRNLFYGAGGRSLAPNPRVRYEFVLTDTKGYSRGYDVRDPLGVHWSVKLGDEAQPEVVVSRLLWAIGYHQPETYLLENWTLVGADAQSGIQGRARFRREPGDQKVLSDWSWRDNPFVGTRPFNGLIVANLILNNWDWKTSNNKIYEVRARNGVSRRLYVVRDLGASLGKTSFPHLLRWLPLKSIPQGSRNDVEDFEAQKFIESVHGRRVKFDYGGVNGPLLDALTIDDVVWTCSLLSRLSNGQWRDVFRAAGYDAEHQQRYITKLKSKIREGLALSQRT